MANIPREAGPGLVAERPEWTGWRAPELTVVVPTFNERANVAALVERLERRPRRHRLGGGVRRRRFARRHRRGGARARPRATRACAASAASAGAAWPRPASRACCATSAPYVAVMDADLQHDEALLPAMLARLRRGDADLVVGSRYARRTAASGWGEGRRRISRLATRLGRGAAGRRPHRPDERLLHAAPRGARARAARPVGAGLQDPARHSGDRPAAAAGQRAALPLPRRVGPARASSTPGRARFPAAARRQAGRPLGAGPLPAFAGVGRLGGLHLAVLALLYRLAGRLRARPGRGDRGRDDDQFRAQQRADLPRPAAARAGAGCAAGSRFVLACGVGLGRMSASPPTCTAGRSAGCPRRWPASRWARCGTTPRPRSTRGAGEAASRPGRALHPPTGSARSSAGSVGAPPRADA